MGSAIETDIAKLQAEIRQLREDFSLVAGTLRDLARHGTEGVTDEMASARQSADRLWSDAKGKAGALAGEVERQPLGAAIAAFVAGMVLALLFTARQK